MPAPRIVESYEPERITLSLQIYESGDNDKKVTVKAVEIEKLLGVKKSRARKLLSDLIEDGIILAEGANRNRVYKLK